MSDSAFAPGDHVTISRELGELALAGRTLAHGDVGVVVGIADPDVYDIDFSGDLVEGLPLAAGGVTVLEPADDAIDPVDTIFGRE